jgi:hypothetical protein
MGLASFLTCGLVGKLDELNKDGSTITEGSGRHRSGFGLFHRSTATQQNNPPQIVASKEDVGVLQHTDFRIRDSDVRIVPHDSTHLAAPDCIRQDSHQDGTTDIESVTRSNTDVLDLPVHLEASLSGPFGFDE